MITQKVLQRRHTYIERERQKEMSLYVSAYLPSVEREEEEAKKQKNRRRGS